MARFVKGQTVRYTDGESPTPDTVAARILIVAAEGRTFHGEVTGILADGNYVVGSPTGGIYPMVCWVYAYSDRKPRSANHCP